jgi:hypothetical protein
MKTVSIKFFNRILIIRNFSEILFRNIDIFFGNIDILDDWSCYFKILYKTESFNDEENRILKKMIRIFNENHDLQNNYYSKEGLDEFKECKNKFLSLPSIQKDLQFIEEQKKKHGEKWATVLLEEAKKNEEPSKKAEKKKFWKFWT